MIDFCCLLQTKKNSCLGTSHPVSGIIKQWYPFPFSFLFLRRVPVPVSTNNSPLYEFSQIVCLTNLYYIIPRVIIYPEARVTVYVLYSDLYFAQNQVYKQTQNYNKPGILLHFYNIVPFIRVIILYQVLLQHCTGIF